MAMEMATAMGTAAATAAATEMGTAVAMQGTTPPRDQQLRNSDRLDHATWTLIDNKILRKIWTTYGI